MDESTEKRILDFVEKEGKASAGKIGGVLGINYYKLEEILAELLSKNKLELLQETKGTYYIIKKKVKKKK